MLKVVSFSHSEQKLASLNSFEEKTETWLVSDLRSKFELQNSILARAEGYEDLSVYRASELWRLLLRRLRPEMRVAPREFLMSWLTHYLKKLSKGDADSLLKPQSAKTFVAMMDLLAPVFLNSEGPAHLEEFFRAHPAAAERWQVWAQLSQALFQVILQQNWCLPAWIPSLLVHEPELESVWDRSLWVDLGAGLRQSEVDLLKRFSQTLDVTVFIPELKEKAQFPFLLQPSDELRGVAQEIEKAIPAELTGETQCLRFSGPLAEVKHAVSLVREWLEQGIPAQKIALVAPEIEDYWPLLEPFFEVEGIPIQKDAVTRLQSWPSVTAWLSRLRLRSGQVSYSDLETGLNTDDLRLRFEKFRAQFRNSLEIEDLQRAKELEIFFSLGGTPDKEINLEEFMAWSARDWRDFDNWEGFEILLKEILQAVPKSVTMDLDAWLGYLETLAVKKEIRLKPADMAGVALVNLTSVDGSKFERRIFLGLSESNFRKQSTVLVGAHELNRLGWDFGYFLDHPEQHLMNFELHWALQSPSPQDWLFFPATGFTASSEAPHPVWIRKGGTEKVQVPASTRWDEIQNSDLVLGEKHQRDLGLVSLPALEMKQIPRFSISAIEKFRTCSFQFAVEKVFHLLDVPERDLDLDARSKGSLAHKLFETLTAPPRRFDWTDPELRTLLDGLREEVRLQDREGLFWEIDKERHVGLAQRFLKFEEKWEQDYPRAQVEAREQKFEFYFEPVSETFTMQKSETSVLIKGSIDRVETDQAGWKLVVDYKTNHDPKKNFKNWIEMNQLQLGFYSWVIDRGFAPGLSPGKVGGAVTFAYRKMEKQRGFITPEIVGRLGTKPEP